MYQELLWRVEETKGRKILNLGCGNGNVLAELQKLPELELHGLDLSEEMIREAKKLSDKVPLRVGDAEQLPYEEGSFNEFPQ